MGFRDPILSRSFLAQRTLRLADEHRSAGRDDTAALLYRQVLDTDPGDAEALDGLGGATGAGPAVRSSLTAKVVRRVAVAPLHAASQRPRVWKYRALSTCVRISGTPRVYQPVLYLGSGEIVMGEGVQFGWRTGPAFYTGYCHVEAAGAHTRIELGDGVEFNNNALLKSEGPGIRIGARSLFGANVEVLDSDFHDLHPARRHGGTPATAAVEIAENVFVGMSVKILKGVTIGADSVIGAGAVVTTSIPAGVIAGGNPARVIREL